MKRGWPKVSASLRFEFDADHSMPRIHGCEARHTHHYDVQFGYTHEIQPMSGYTHEVTRQRKLLAKLIARVDGQYLNDVLPMQPSVEVLALWLLAETESAYCSYVVVQAYGDYSVRVDRELQLSAWSEFLRGRAGDPFSNEVFTLK